MTDVIGAIDCGTNSTRLLIIDDDRNQLVRECCVTRLGELVDTTKILGDLALDRTLEVLKSYKATGDKYGVTRWGIVATSAVRDSKNSYEFTDKVKSLFGQNPKILSGYKEAILTFVGAMSGLDTTDEQVVVIDIGGGSTEIVCGQQKNYLKSEDYENNFLETSMGGSVDIGCVRLTERYLKSDPVSATELEAALNYAESLFATVSLRIQRLNPSRIYAVAGTAISLFMISHNITKYSRKLIHNQSLKLSEIETLLYHLAKMSLSERQNLPTLEIQRAEVIVAGAIIFYSAVKSFGLEFCNVLESDILDGLAIQTLISPT